MSNTNRIIFAKVVRFIHDNLDQPIDLSDIAKANGLSVSNLKRLFLEATDITVGSFIRRLRMERAFRSLQNNKENTVLEIALDSGFEDHSAFTRAFKNNFGYAPTTARKKLNIVNELECIILAEPEYVEINTITLQAITKRGNTYFEAAPLAWQGLKEHLTTVELDDDFAGVFIGIGHDDPHKDPPSQIQVRFSACIVYDTTDLHIEKIDIAAGTYAKFNYTGKPNNLGLAYHYIYGTWLANSERKINEKIPAFQVFDKFPDSFKEDDLSIYVPLSSESSTHNIS